MSAARVMAIPPPFISDQEMARFPVIVEARWDRRPFRAHYDVEDNALKNGECFTKLTVLRVIKGDLKPGEHELLPGYNIGWSETGGEPMSFMSTQMCGDVEEVCQANLWCLEWTRSWDKSDPKNYLSLTNYRAIQPLVLEAYFHALGHANPDDAIAKLLRGGVPKVCLRCLEFVNGGAVPWPYWGEFEEWYRGTPDPADRRVQLAPHVRPLMRHEDAEVRRMATATYGSLTDDRAVPALRERLTDSDDGVRAIAVGILAKYRDIPSIESINEACTGIHNGHLGCAAVDKLLEWGDVRLVPGLIRFLDEGDYAGRIGDDIFIPSLRARAGLERIVGFTFPLDADRSGRAWKAALSIDDRQKRIDRLAQLLPDKSAPIRAQAIGDVKNCKIRVTNTDQRKWTVTTRPADLEICFNGNSHSMGVRPRLASQFVTLAAGESVEYPVQIPDRLMLAEPKDRSVNALYLYDGHQFGLKAWLGKVAVEFGDGWNEPPRELIDGDEFWPNGNWKARGKMLFDKRVGLWEWFNEAGDRTETFDYTRGGAAECDPEHPANKGAGKRNSRTADEFGRTTSMPSDAIP